MYNSKTLLYFARYYNASYVSFILFVNTILAISNKKSGDSLVKNLQGCVCLINNHVVVKSFSGATLTDMEDRIKPVIRKEPNNLFLHIGTNDLSKISPKRVAEGIANLGIQIKEDSPGTVIVISSILPTWP